MISADRLARLDTSALARPGRPTRALVVVNTHDTPFDGIAALRADFRTREILPVTVADASGVPVPSRIVDEEIGPVEADGRRRWRFVLEFAVTLAARTVDAWAAWWGEGGPALVVSDDAPRLPAVERECVPGQIALPADLGVPPPSEEDAGSAP